ncbi:MAG: TIGR01777 family oxidoreductase [Myxococcota bacterium]
MRILVTGATGFIGRALVEALQAAEHGVVVVSRSPESAAAKLPNAEAVSWDSLDDTFATGIDAVVHLAGETVQGRWNKKKLLEVRDSRIKCTQILMAAIKKAAVPPSVLVSASGIGFYGEGGETPLSETADCGDDYFAALCVDWEAEAAQARDVGCRVVLARFGIVIGIGGGALNAMLLPAQLGVGGPLGSGRQWWSWVSLDDAVGAIQYALSNDSLDGPMNVVAPEPIRQHDFQRVLGRVLSRPSFMPAPAFALKLILGTFAQEVLSSKRVLPSALEGAGYQFTATDLEAVLRSTLS